MKNINMWEGRSKAHTIIDIPTAMTEEERILLEQLAVHDKVVIEIGSLMGYATVAMARVAQVVYAIDPHEGYPTHNPSSTLEMFLHNLKRYKVEDRVVTILARGQQILPYLYVNPGLIFIDTMGDYEGTSELLLLSQQHCPRHIAVHDYGREDTWDCSGVKKSVDNFLKIYRNWKHDLTVNTLAVLRREERKI